MEYIKQNSSTKITEIVHLGKTTWSFVVVIKPQVAEICSDLRSSMENQNTFKQEENFDGHHKGNSIEIAPIDYIVINRSPSPT